MNSGAKKVHTVVSWDMIYSRKNKHDEEKKGGSTFNPLNLKLE